jgi:O-succinylbenzoate synthase
MAPQTPSLDEVLSGFHVVSLPLEKRFRGLTSREIAIIELDGGVGEWAAFGEYCDDEASWWLAAALEQPSMPLASDSVEPVSINGIIPAMPASDIEEWWQHFEGCKAVKIKVAEPGETLDEDIARVGEVRQVVGPEVGIRLDANAAWSPAEAKGAIEALERFEIDYVEQPVATLEEMSQLRRLLGSSPIRLAADEVVRKTHQLNQVRDTGCDVVIVKPSPLGGFSHTMRLAQEAHESGLEVVVSSGLESSVGLSHATHVAIAIDRLAGKSIPHGLGTAALFHRDIVTAPLMPHRGFVSPRPIELDREALAELRVSPEREAWWRSRLERCFPLALEKLS